MAADYTLPTALYVDTGFSDFDIEPSAPASNIIEVTSFAIDAWTTNGFTVTIPTADYVGDTVGSTFTEAGGGGGGGPTRPASGLVYPRMC